MIDLEMVFHEPEYSFHRDFILFKSVVRSVVYLFLV